MRFFYLIWVDALIRVKSQPANKRNWKFRTFAIMTLPMALDLFFILYLLQIYWSEPVLCGKGISIISEILSTPLGFVILIFGTPVAINYFFIFRNRRYERLMKEYEYNNGKLAVTYIISGLMIPFVFFCFELFWG
jgi:hypothetical protein